MKKTKKVLAGVFAFALVAPMLTAPVFAATETATAEVSYDNTNSVPDPDNPDNPDWAVKIPSSVVFTDANSSINVDVELISVNGGTLPTTDIKVTVASKNNYMLQMTGVDTDDVSYILQYGGTSMSSTNTTVGTLKDSNTKATGTARLAGTAKKTGAHTDTLTYTIDNAPTLP